MARRNHNSLLCLVLFGIITLIYYSYIHSSNVATSDLLASGKNAPITKHLVVAALSSDDTSWIARRLPAWDASIYIANSSTAPLTVPQNKGREAMVYLTYLIDNYDTLPDVAVFIHALQYQWHNDDPNYDSATLLSRLQLPFVREAGYASLRCAWRLGCPDEIHVSRVALTSPLSSLSSSSSPSSSSSSSSGGSNNISSQTLAEAHFATAFTEIFPDRPIPPIVGAGCCAQFAVSREQIQHVPRREFERIRAWLLATELEDEVSGRIMEYSWHMLFGREPVFCPSAGKCYCEVFGLCGLECTEGDCGRYFLPPQSNAPGWWKEDPALVNEVR